MLAAQEIAEIESALETQAREWGRQRDFSEKRLAGWQSKTKVTEEKAQYLNNQRIAENSALLVECNDLRQVNRDLKTQCIRLQGALKEVRGEAAAASKRAVLGGTLPAGTPGISMSQRGGCSRPGTAGSASSGSSRQTAASTVFTYRSGPGGGSRPSTPGVEVPGRAGMLKASGPRPGSGSSTGTVVDVGGADMGELPPRAASAMAAAPGGGDGVGRLYKGRTGMGGGIGRPVSAGPAMMLPGSGAHAGIGGRPARIGCRKNWWI